MGILITGTDTGVGKTTAAAALVKAARALGLRVGAMKPAESGCARDGDGALIPADALLLREVAGGGDPLDLVCPFRLHAPLAPGLAAAKEGVDLDLEVIERAYAQLCERHAQGVVVEGAGGLLVPLDPGFATVADLAQRLSLAVLVVARDRLGTINHTALTVEALATRGIECRGVILSASSPDSDGTEGDNARAIERLADVPVLLRLPYVEGQEKLAVHADLFSSAHRGGKMDLAALLA